MFRSRPRQRARRNSPHIISTLDKKYAEERELHDIFSLVVVARKYDGRNYLKSCGMASCYPLL